MEKDFDVFQMYIRELEAVEACGPAENARLVRLAAAGDEKAKLRLIEGNLKYVLEISRDFAGLGVPVPDLVQEANMALLMAADEYREPPAHAGSNAGETFAGMAAGDVCERAAAAGGAASEGAFETYLSGRVREALQAAVDESKAQSQISRKVLERVNKLQDVSRDMAEELGREATVPELAQRLKMTEEEVKDIMKVALDALKALGEPV